MRKKRIIFSNMDIFKDQEELAIEYAAINEIDFDTLTEEDKMDICELENESWYYAEEDNLQKEINPILVIADLGLWNGRKQGYKIIQSGNIADILKNHNDYFEVYSDGYNIKCTDCHHDGTNYYMYREIRNMDNIQNLLDKIYDGEEITNSTLNRYTKSILSYVKEIYGW